MMGFGIDNFYDAIKGRDKNSMGMKGNEMLTMPSKKNLKLMCRMLIARLI